MSEAQDFVKDKLWQRLMRGMKGSLALRVTYLILGFLLSVILARLLGVKEFGVYTYVMSWVWLISVFTKMGFAELLVREVAVFNTNENWGLLQGILNFSNRIVLVLSLIVLIAFCVAAFQLFPNYLYPNLRASFFVGFLILPFISLIGLRQGALNGFGRVVLSQVTEMLVKPVGLLLCFLGIWYFWPDRINSVMALWVNLIVTAGAFIFGYLVLQKVLNEKGNRKSAEYRELEWSKSALRFLFIGGMLVVNSQTDKIMLGAMGYIEEVGIYSTAYLIAAFTGYPLVALTSSLAPVVVKLTEAKANGGLQRILLDSVKFVLFVSALIAILLVLLSSQLLSLFGGEFITGKSSLIVLVIAQLGFVSFGPAGLILNMIGREILVSKVIAVSACANILLNYVLIPRYGMVGAAIATATSMLGWSIVLAVFLFKEVGINSSPLVPFGSTTED